MKKCFDCKKSFPMSGFHKGQGVCKSCNRERVKKWRKANPEKAREQYRRNKRNRRMKRAMQNAEAQMEIDVVEPEASFTQNGEGDGLAP